MPHTPHAAPAETAKHAEAAARAAAVLRTFLFTHGFDIDGDRSFSVAQIAHECGLSRESVAAILDGQTTDLSSVMILCGHYNFSLGAALDQDRRGLTHVIIYPYEGGEPAIRVSVPELPGFSAEDVSSLFWVPVKSSMIKDVPDGAMAICTRKVDEPQPGKIYLLESGDELFLQRCEQASSSGVSFQSDHTKQRSTSIRLVYAADSQDGVSASEPTITGRLLYVLSQM